MDYFLLGVLFIGLPVSIAAGVHAIRTKRVSGRHGRIIEGRRAVIAGWVSIIAGIATLIYALFRHFYK